MSEALIPLPLSSLAFRCPLRRRNLGRYAPHPPGEIEYHSERFTRLLVEGETNVNTIIGETFDEGVLVSQTQGRVNGGRAEGGQFACTEHSDAVVTLSPAAQRTMSITATATSSGLGSGSGKSLTRRGDEFASRSAARPRHRPPSRCSGVLPHAATLS